MSAVARVGASLPAVNGRPVAAPADLREAARFLALLDPDADEFHFRTFDDSDAKRTPLARLLSGSLDGVASELVKMQACGAGVFVVVNRGGQRADRIDRVRSLFADLDGAPLEPIMACGLEPHIVVETSPGRWHAYWLADGVPLEEFAPMQRAIAARFGADPHVVDLPRVMRLPGFDHRKAAPHRVRIIHESGALPYSAERVRAVFALQGATTPAPEPYTHGNDALVHVEPAVIGDLRSALAHLRADDRATWIAIGAALRQLGDTGRGLWVAWSQTSAKWQPCDAGTWDTLGHDATGYAAVFAKAQARGWINPRAGGAGVPVAARNEGSLLRVVDAAVIDTAKPPAFVVAPIIPRRVVTMLNAGGGTGKTTHALGIAAYVGCGVSFGPFAVEQGRCLIVSLEDEAEQIAFQLRTVIAAAGLDAVAVMRNVTILDGAADDISLAHEDRRDGALIADAALMQLAELAQGCALIVIDGVGDALRGNTNDPTIVRDFIRRKLGKIARESNCAILLIGHVDKSGMRHGTGGQTFLGSVEFNNSARSRLAIAERDGRLWLDHEKANRSAKAEPLLLRKHPTGALLPDGGAGSGSDGAALIEDSDADALHAALVAAGAADVNVPTARTGPCTAQHVLATLPELPEPLRDKKGRARFWAAMNRLQRSGRAGSEAYLNEHRHLRKRWVAL